MPTGPDQTNPARQTGADSTDIHGGDAAAPLAGPTSSSGRLLPPDAFGSAKSIRLKPKNIRGGLATRLAIPVIISLILGLILLALVIRQSVFKLQMNDLKAEAANTAFILGQTGRLLITHQEKFLKDHPDYLHKAEWRAGDHWLVEHGFVNASDWIDATGFQLDEYAPSSVLEKAGQKTILSDIDRYLNSNRVHTEIVGVFILGGEGEVIAASRRASFRYDYFSLRAIPMQTPYQDVGGIGLAVDYVENPDMEAVVRGVAKIMSRDDPTKQMGTAAVIIRPLRHYRDQNAFMFTLLGMALLLSILMALASWYSARRVVAPMRRLADDMQAMAEGDYTRRAGVTDADETGMLAQAFNSMAERLRVARLNEKESNRLESDLAIAREIQNNLLPMQTPRVRGLDIFTSYRPAKEIGGDYFDFLPIDDSHMGLVIADASGKSIPAALVMSNTRAILRFAAPGNTSASDTLTRVNAILSVDIPKGMFVTAYYVLLDPLNGSMLCASAGHTPLLIARGDGSVELLNPGGIALGFDSGPIFERSIREQKVKLTSGDRVLLYTDGVVECVNPVGEEYSDRRLREFLRRNRALSSHDFVGALMADLDRHRGAADMRDDTTIVTFRVL